MSCHASPADDLLATHVAEIALVGHPNVGKSALFRRLTGRYVTVSNLPGTTMDVFRGASRTLPGVVVVDTPGIVGFPARSEDERVVSRLLLDNENAGDTCSIVQVGDSKNVRRTLQLTVQLIELGLPLVLVLNMRDEAEAAGVWIDAPRLAALLGVPVLSTVATSGAGVDCIADAAAEARPGPPPITYPAPIEAAIAELTGQVESAPVVSTGLALLWLAGDEEAGSAISDRLGDELPARILARTTEALGETPALALHRARFAFVNDLAGDVVEQGRKQGGDLLQRLARLTTHRLWGWPILAAVLLGVYFFVGVLGAGTLVGLLENSLFGRIVNPWLAHEVRHLVPSKLAADFIVGPYGLWTMAVTYALALILPIVTTFFLAFSLLEDSGYLPRLAVVSNRVFRALGLNGKAALPLVLGLGCVTMATLTTRILETRRERFLATLMLALGIPCSAQLGVVLGLLGSISPAATLIWASVVAAVVVVVGALASHLVPGERSPLLLELPPLRVPHVGNVVAKTLARVEWYLREVVPLFLAGTAFLFVLDRTGALPAIVHAARPLVTGWLGLPAAASTAFLVGFLRRDFGATGLFVMHANGQLTAEQSVVAMVTITLFIPCVASILIIARERGAASAAGLTALIFPLAFGVGGLLHQTLLLVGRGA